MKSLWGLVGIILIGLVIFGYAGICKAQSAWVLWLSGSKIRFLPQGQQIEKPEWNLISAFPKYEQCIEFKRKKIEEMKEVFKLPSEPPEPEVKDTQDGIVVNFGVNKSLTNGWIWTIHWHCLPETIDPRK